MILLCVGCAAPAPAPTTQAAAPEPAPVAVPAAKSEAVARADALVDDMRRRQAAQTKLDRESPAPPPPNLDALLRAIPAPAPPPPPPAPTAPSRPAPAPSLLNSPERTFGGKNEAEWKSEMRYAEERLADHMRRLKDATAKRAEAENVMRTHGLWSPAYNTAKEALDRADGDIRSIEQDVKSHRAIVDGIRLDARRSSVPAGWLRWP